MTLVPPEKLLYHNRPLIELSREELIAACADVFNSYSRLYQLFTRLKNKPGIPTEQEIMQELAKEGQR